MNAQLNDIRKTAAIAAENAARAWFRSRAREFGGVNARNRAQIEDEARKKGAEAAYMAYVNAGYRRCLTPSCENLTTPLFVHGKHHGNYPLCPSCESQQSSFLAPVGAPARF